MGRGVHYGDAATRRGLSRVGYFITLNGSLNGHPPSLGITPATVLGRVFYFYFYYILPTIIYDYNWEAHVRLLHLL